MIRFISLGDSSGVGVGAGLDGGYPARLGQRLKAHGHDLQQENLAESGATSDDVVNDQLARAVALRPHLVTVGIGGNDLWRMVPATRYGQNVTRIVDELTQAGAVVVIGNIIDLSLAPVARLAKSMLGIDTPEIRARLQMLNSEIARVATKENVDVVDLYTVSQRELGFHPEYFAGDGFHPSALGYDRWTDILWPHVERAARRLRDAGLAGATRAG